MEQPSLKGQSIGNETAFGFQSERASAAPAMLSGAQAYAMIVVAFDLAGGPASTEGRMARPVSRAGRRPLHDLEPDLDVAAGGVGIGTNLVRFFHQSLCLGMREAGKGDLQVDVEAKAAGRARSDADRRGHRRIGGYFRAALRSHELHRADETGGVSGREKL